MAEEWGPWIEHDGKGCPVVGQVVEAVCQDGLRDIGVPTAETNNPPPGFASSWVWASIPKKMMGHKVVRYRVRKSPSRGFKILQKIAATPSQPVREDA